MNAMVNKLFLAEDTVMSEMHLKQPGLTYNACGPFTIKYKINEKIQRNWRFRNIYQNKLDQACFQHDMASGWFKDLNRRRTADKVLHDKAFNLDKNLKCNSYQSGLTSTWTWFINVFIKNILVEQLKNKLCLIKN